MAASMIGRTCQHCKGRKTHNAAGYCTPCIRKGRGPAFKFHRPRRTNAHASSAYAVFGNGHHPSEEPPAAVTRGKEMSAALKELRA